MAEKVYPSTKPAANGTATTTAIGGGANPSFPANKAQPYLAARPAYRPQPRRGRSRSCCCTLCLFLTLTIILLILMAAIAGGVLWVLYRPHRPSFSVASLQISQFNLTSSTQLTTKFNLTVTARNPNKKITFLYDPISVSIFSDDVDAGNGSLPGFTHGTKNTTSLRTTLSTTGQGVDSSSNLKSDLKSLALKIQLDTKVKVKIGGMKTKKVMVRVKCAGIKAAAPTGKSATMATTSNAKCKVDLRFKIWKWTV